MPVWGKADPGAAITIRFAGQIKTAVANDNGKWRTDLESMPASADPQTLTVTSSIGNQQVTIGDVLIGEVWLCSGQSNMQWTMAKSENGAASIAAANHP